MTRFKVWAADHEFAAVLIIVVIALLVSYAGARFGHPSASWLWCDKLALCSL